VPEGDEEGTWGDVPEREIDCPHPNALMPQFNFDCFLAPPRVSDCEEEEEEEEESDWYVTDDEYWALDDDEEDGELAALFAPSPNEVSLYLFQSM